MNKIILFFLLMACSTLIKGQEKKRDSGIILLLGPSVTYQIGHSESDLTYTESRLSWQVDGQFGFISTRSQTNRGNMLLVFGSAGSTTPFTLQELYNASIYAEETLPEASNFNLYYTLEGGMIIMKFLRLSGGAHRQMFNDAEGNQQYIRSYIGTAGLNFDFGSVNLGINASVLAGNDVITNIFRLSTGFLVKF